MFDSISLLIFMFFGFCFGLVMYLYALSESKWLFVHESKLLSWLRAIKLFDGLEIKQETVSNSNAHEIVVNLGERLEKEDVESYQKIKNELHPQAIEYFHRTKGMNVEPAVINKPKLKLVK